MSISPRTKAILAEALADQTAANDLAATLAAGGGTPAALAHLTAAPSASVGAINLIGSPDVNVVGPTADAVVVLGGTATFPHTIGNASLAVIPGGYDDHVVNDSIMAVLLGAHHLIDSAGGHGSIGGGSYGTVHGDYGHLAGGTQNREVGHYGTVGGGRQNTAGAIAATTLSAQAAAGQNQIVTAVALVAGRTVFIDDGSGCESFTVSSISGTTSTLSGNLTKTHASGVVVLSSDGSATDATVGGGVTNRALKLQATVGGGSNNLVGGVAGTIGGGINNLVNTSNGTVAGGTNNAISGSSAAGTIAGGDSNASTAGWTAVGGGQSNTAGADYSGIPSGKGAKAYIKYSRALSGGFFAVAGDAQSWELPLRRQTTDAAATELRSDGATEQLALPDNTCWRFTARIVGWRPDTHVAVADLKLEGTIARGTGAASAALFGSVVKTAGSGNAVGSDAAASADTTLGGLSVKVTGLAGVTIRWSARLEVIEVAG